MNDFTHASCGLKGGLVYSCWGYWSGLVCRCWFLLLFSFVSFLLACRCGLFYPWCFTDHIIDCFISSLLCLAFGFYWSASIELFTFGSFVLLLSLFCFLFYCYNFLFSSSSLAWFIYFFCLKSANLVKWNLYKLEMYMSDLVKTICFLCLWRTFHKIHIKSNKSLMWNVYYSLYDLFITHKYKKTSSS